MASKHTDWTILREFEGFLGNSSYNRMLAEVQCTCGKIEIRRLDHVASGRTQRCKSCSARKTLQENRGSYFLSHNWQGVGDISLTLFNTYKYGAERRGLDFKITIEYLWQLYEIQNRVCALSGLPITFSKEIVNSAPDYSKITASPDRIDNYLGYVPSNVQIVHKTVNKMRQSLSVEEFVHFCKAVSNNYANSEPSSPKGKIK